MFISYSDIPNFSNIYLDYLYEFENVEKYYKRNFRAYKSFENVIEGLKIKDRSIAKKLSQIIFEQYTDWNPSEKTVKNIEALKSSETFAVITGQQIGLLGGPLYALYKTITAIKLCEKLSFDFPNYKFVPVFWMEADDHDFEEIRNIYILNKNNELVQISYDESFSPEKNYGSIGNLKLDGSIENFINTLENELKESDFKTRMIEELRQVYYEKAFFKDSFKRMFFKYFDKYGLIIFNPCDKAVKDILKPIFLKEINSFNSHSSKIIELSADIDESYHAQVKVRPINLFILENDGRFLIEPEDDYFKLKGKRIKYSKEELLEIIENAPERISPNVLLRPICQDFLFPTLSYVAGPSEISYFAQLIPLYDIFEIDQPIVYPRASATILDKNIKPLLEKNSLSFNDFFLEYESIIKKTIALFENENIDNLFNDIENIFNAQFVKLKEKFLTIDKTLISAAETMSMKTFQNLNTLKSKVTAAQKQKYEAKIRQISKLKNIIFPNDALQERSLNHIYFYNKYGEDFLDIIFSELNINAFEHQIIEI